MPLDSKEHTSEDESNEKAIVVDTIQVQSIKHDDVPGESARLALSKKESVSNYFTIAAAAFGLIR